MGRGDKRTTKGKIFKGSYGKKRPRKTKDKVNAGAGKGIGKYYRNRLQAVSDVQVLNLVSEEILREGLPDFR